MQAGIDSEMTLHFHPATYVAISVLIGLATPISSAQTSTDQSGFGGSTFGRRPSSGAGSGQLSAISNQGIGTLSSGRRFQRGRRRGQFVGTDVREQQQQGFTGAVQAAPQGSTATAAPTVIKQGVTAAQINTPRQPAPSSAPYDPPLVIAFDAADARRDSGPEQLTTILDRIPALRDCQINVTVDGHTVALSGEVAQARQVRLAEQMLRMEPGVHQVLNHLRYRRPPRSLAPAIDEELPPLPATQ